MFSFIEKKEKNLFLSKSSDCKPTSENNKLMTKAEKLA